MILNHILAYKHEVCAILQPAFAAGAWGCTVRPSRRNGMGCPSAEIGTGHGKVAGIHATAWLLHFIQKLQPGANVPRNPLPLVYTVRKNSSCRATVVSATVLPSRKMSTTGEKNQLLQLYGRTRESSLLELYCRTKQTRQEGMQIDSQSFESRGVRHACFCMLTLLVLTYFLLVRFLPSLVCPLFPFFHLCSIPGLLQRLAQRQLP